VLKFLKSGKKKKRPPRLPAGVRIYAIGDVHGRADLLDAMLSRIDKDIAANPVPRPIHVLLGDYIDRGEASSAVLDRLVRLKRSRETVLLKGNHETYIFEFLSDPGILQSWQQLGGLETLMSYGLRPTVKAGVVEQRELAQALGRVLPETHRRLLGDLKLSFTCGDFFFVHAGVRPGVKLQQQREEDLLWIRDDFLLCEDDFGKVIVHGHTPVREPDIRANRINIDTGAYATGRLTCLIMEDDAFIVA
jgi:serine/threonine protein phosphatase 1